MSKEAFLRKFDEDKEFADKVLALTSFEDAKALFVNEGFEFGDEDITTYLEGLEKLKSGSMSDEELDQAVGGFGAGSGLRASSDAETFRESARIWMSENDGADGFRAGSGLR